jgi:hypothetical protein
MRIEIEVKRGHLSLGKKEQGGEEIDCQALFNDYWNTTAHEFPVRGQLESPTSPFIADRKGIAGIVAGKHRCSLELRFSAEVTVRLLTIVHRQATYTVRIDGFSTLLAPWTRKIAKELLPTDDRIDREVFGKGYQSRGCILGSQFSVLPH